MSDLPRTFGDFVKAERKRADLTATEAARRVGITKAFWSDIEHGRRRPSPETAIKMCDVLGVGAAKWGLALAREQIGTEVFDLVMTAAIVDERARIRQAVLAQQERFRSRGNDKAAAGLSAVFPIIDMIGRP